MEISWNDDELRRLEAEIQRKTEPVLNAALTEAHGLPIGRAIALVADRLREAGVEPNEGAIHELLVQQGFTA